MNKQVKQEHKNIIGKLLAILSTKEQLTQASMIDRVKTHFPEYRELSDQEIKESFNF
jgi:hypothetical protein